MLSYAALESARELSEFLLNRRGRVAKPVEGTPLERLVQLGEPITTETPETVNEAIESLAESTYTAHQITPVTHDDVLQGNIDQIAGIVNRRLALARDIINPIIKTFCDGIEAELSKLVPTDPQVQEHDFSPFYRNPLVLDALGGYNYKMVGMGPVASVEGVELNETNHYLRNAMNTGSSLIDNELKAVLERRGEDWFRSVVVEHFRDGAELPVLRPELSDTYREGLDRNLVVHMVARHLHNNEYCPAHYENDEEYRLALKRVLTRSSQNIVGVGDYQDRLEREGTITTAVSTEGVLDVYSPNYKSYLQQGGNNLMLFGYFKTGEKKAVTISNLLAKGPSLESVYDDAMREEISEIRKNRYKLLVEASRKLLPEIIEMIPNDVLLTIPSLNTNEVPAQGILLKRGMTYISTISTIVEEDICKFATRFITVGLLPELELARFYEIMDTYLQPEQDGTTQGSLSPKRAAYYAILEEIVRCYLSCTEVEFKQA